MKGVKGIIFDWGRTLWDNESGKLFPESKQVLEHCKKKGYRLALLSVSGDPNAFPEKERLIESSGIKSFFDHVIVSTKKDREEIDAIALRFKLPYHEILMVGDRTAREVKIANVLGMHSIWIQKGKFANETPTRITGEPTHTVPSLSAITEIV